ncbi:MAG TPA: PPC domain-containing DNA-binding protein [Thermodesulfobacteriota bacterium]|nr:PPC domain-containing DNA-binding protein [Thermodesulfobacteriota bacterium]
MKASEGRVGRAFVIRLEHGDVIPDCIERFAEEKKILVGQVMLIGGIGEGQVVVGPRRSNEMPAEPMLVPVDGAHEMMGVGVIAPDKTGKPVLHVHGSLGRSGKATTGCLRPGVSTWTVGEVIICEILGATAVRELDEKTKFDLLQVK